MSEVSERGLVEQSFELRKSDQAEGATFYEIMMPCECVNSLTLHCLTQNVVPNQ